MQPRRGLAVVLGLATAVPLTALTLHGGSAANAGPGPSGSFHRVATYPVFHNVPSGVDPDDETVAEISDATDDGRTMIYTDAAGQRIGFLDITDPAAPVGRGSIDVTSAGAGSDEPTSVAVIGDYVAVVIDTSNGDYVAPSGRVDVYRIADRSLVRSIDLGGQPDSIAVSPDRSYAAIAIENQRDEDHEPTDGGLPQAPAGFVQVLDLAPDPADWTSTRVDLPAAALTGMDTPEDPEPEFVDINHANQAVVTLQENNGLVVLDLADKSITTAFSAGNAAVGGIDVADDGYFDFTGDVDVPREPDAVQWVGHDLVATANEGDWKGGTRGWSVFDVSTGEVVWDAGNSFEMLAVEHGLHNESRADNKGSEPEGLAFGEIDGTPYAFVGSERSNFVAVYDMSTPTQPQLRQVLPTTNGPEGLLPIPSRDLFVVSSETDEADNGVRATIGVYELGEGRAAFPSIVSEPERAADDHPIGWGALGALSAAPGDAGHLWTASDSAYATGRIYRVNVATTPAVIEKVIEVTEGGSTPAIDIEGLHARESGGFWLALEGATGAENRLVRTDARGRVRQSVPLPDDVARHVRNWGLEGVTATGTGDDEVVHVALQRPLWQDPSVAAGELRPLEGDLARIGRYEVARDRWTWFTYPLESTSTPGDWIGLSEVTTVDDQTLAVIERDKLNGPAARVKRVYTVDLPGTGGPADAPVALTKELAVDVLPALRSDNGWTQEKLEGLTIGADGQLWAVTDNDGLDDATGETQLLRLGRAADVFAAPAPPKKPKKKATSTRLRVKKLKGRNVRLAAVVKPRKATGRVVFRVRGKVVARVSMTKGRAVTKVRLPRVKKRRVAVRATYRGDRSHRRSHVVRRIRVR